MPFVDQDGPSKCQRRHLQYHGGEVTLPPAEPEPSSLRTSADVLALLHRQMEAVRLDPEAGTLEKARIVGYLAGIALKAIEASDLAARIEMLEAVLKLRNAEAKR